MSDKDTKNKMPIPEAAAKELEKHKLKLITYEPVEEPEPNEDQFIPNSQVIYYSDAEADADALASAGHGMDEDYGGTDERL